jgi:toxin-antitoxin system PIN domain toxin
MILPDLNLLIYAYNEGAPDHSAARQWWENLVNSGEPVGLPVAVAVGFVRLMTNPKVVQPPMLLTTAVATVEEWLSYSQVSLLSPTVAHWRELEMIGWSGPAVSDAHLAAIAIEHGCELHSNDTDFAGCPRLVWRNPLPPQSAATSTG